MTTASFAKDAPPARVARHFFVHSGHVPLVLVILESLLARPGYFAGVDPYILLLAGLAQAATAALCESRQRSRPWVTNLVGPLLYTVVEAALEGPAFFAQWHHQAYWAFALAFALLQSLQARARGPAASVLVLAENVVRSAIPLVMYALFEARIKATPLSFSAFFDDRAHDFLAVVLLLLGVLLGFADLNLRRSMATIEALSARLRTFSEWSLGREILDRAIADERTLQLQRVERYVMFLDIRGFTAWSESQAPEAVAGLLNAYYRVAEGSLGGLRAIRIKYTADEVMAVFTGAPQAVDAALGMLAAVRSVLAPEGLSAGAGVHGGLLVEGVLGSDNSRAYDFIGDTVNTAQRLCDAAAAGELLVSVRTCAAAGRDISAQRSVAVKGKRDPLQAAAIRPAT
jgi:class 3 adenylate cyclase